MKRYLSLYRQFIKTNLSAIFAFRANFVSGIIGSFVWGSFHFISILLLTSKVSNFYGWSRDELIMLTASFSFLWGLFHILFAVNFGEMAETIDFGQLDQILLKPIDSQFVLTMRYINFTGFYRVILGVLVILIVITKSNMEITLLNLLGYLLLVACGLILIYSIWFITAASLIWFPRLTNLVDLLFSISGISRYPPEIIGNLKHFALAFLLPLTIFVSTPTKALLHRIFLGDVLVLIVLTILFLIVSRKFWKFALRYYTSASS